MSGEIQQVAQVIRSWSRDDAEELRQWLENYLENQLELSEDFAARIERGKKEIARGEVRVREAE